MLNRNLSKLLMFLSILRVYVDYIVSLKVFVTDIISTCYFGNDFDNNYIVSLFTDITTFIITPYPPIEIVLEKLRVKLKK